MSARRAQSLPTHIGEKKPRSRCLTAICFSWKVLTCVVSHVTLVSLVVAYCIGGALVFQSLEQPHELSVKNGIKNMRRNVTNFIWTMTETTPVLEEEKWTGEVRERLKKFEEEIHRAMRSDGWDGDENETQSQWTFFGALFYSIIVITTIGYGHISPRTDWGKVTTIFYAIVGIPLMLLCLSTIGDVMATSFRFIYWRVCCYVCTREPRRHRRPRHRAVRMGNQRYSSRSQPPPMRRSMKLSPRSADSGFVNYESGLTHAHSDPEMRSFGRMHHEKEVFGKNRANGSGRRSSRRHVYDVEHRGRLRTEDQYNFHEYDETIKVQNKSSRFATRQRNRERLRDRHTVEREHHLSRSKQRFDSFDDDFDATQSPLPMTKRTQSVRSMRNVNLSRVDLPSSQTQITLPRGRSAIAQKFRAKSVDPRPLSSAYYEHVDEEIARKTPILCNRYAIDDMDSRLATTDNALRSQSMPRSYQKNTYDDDQHQGGGAGQRRPIFNRQTIPSRFGNRLEIPEANSPHVNHVKRSQPSRYDEYEEEYDDCHSDDDYGTRSPLPPRMHHRGRRFRRESRTEPLPPSPRIMSPMGFQVNRQTRSRPLYDYDDDSLYDDDWCNYYGDISPKDRPVPIWLCVFLVISYIIAGAFLFHMWEKWTFLDSAYFCFITLTTIGFGDFVPASGVKEKNETSIALCSLYLLFGISLLAMSFNLVQEEFIANVKEVARSLGILKDEEEDD